MENTTAPQQEKFDSQAGYEAAIDAVIAKAKKRIRIFDKQASPAFNSVNRYELLRNFLRASRDNRLYIVLHDAGFLTANCPRIMLLLRHFSHGIAIHETQQHAKHVQLMLIRSLRFEIVELVDNGEELLHLFGCQLVALMIEIVAPRSAVTDVNS